MKTRKECVAALVALLLGAGSASTQASAQSGGVINACVSIRSGAIRLVAAADTCARGENALSWNITGPQGPAGPAGPEGPAGPAGLPGAGLDTGTIVGRLTGCHVGGRVVSIPGKSTMAVTSANGDFEMQYVPFNPHLLTVDLGSAQRQVGTVTVSEAGQEPATLELALNDLNSDNNNCGACGNVCSTGTTCQGGVCVGQACTPGAPCTAGFGICAEGTKTCVPSGAWVCEPLNLPAPETCNGLDDNCDGQVDEGALCPDGQACTMGQCQAQGGSATAAAGTGSTSTAAGTRAVRRPRRR